MSVDFLDLLEAQLTDAAARRHRARRVRLPRIGFEAIVTATAVAAGVALLIALGGGRSSVTHDSGEPAAPAAAHDLRDIRVTVLNGTTITELGGRTAAFLRRSGASIDRVTDAADRVTLRTIVMFRPGHADDATAVRDLLGEPVPPPVPLDASTRAVAGTDSDVVVTVGQDGLAIVTKSRPDRPPVRILAPSSDAEHANAVGQQLRDAGFVPMLSRGEATPPRTQILYRTGFGAVALEVSRVLEGISDRDAALRVRPLASGSPEDEQTGSTAAVVVALGASDSAGEEQIRADSSTLEFADTCPAEARELTGDDELDATAAVLHHWPEDDGAIPRSGHTRPVVRALRANVSDACRHLLVGHTTFVSLELTRYEGNPARSEVTALVSCAGDRWVVWAVLPA